MPGDPRNCLSFQQAPLVGTLRWLVLLATLAVVVMASNSEGGVSAALVGAATGTGAGLACLERMGLSTSLIWTDCL